MITTIIAIFCLVGLSFMIMYGLSKGLERMLASIICKYKKPKITDYKIVTNGNIFKLTKGHKVLKTVDTLNNIIEIRQSVYQMDLNDWIKQNQKWETLSTEQDIKKYLQKNPDLLSDFLEDKPSKGEASNQTLDDIYKRIFSNSFMNPYPNTSTQCNPAYKEPIITTKDVKELAKIFGGKNGIKNI